MNERAVAFVEDARRYAGLGWATIRAEGKRARGLGWEKTRPEPPELVAGKWSHWGERFNLGVVCGPSGLAVLDVDVNGDPIPAVLDLLGLEQLPATPIVRTGSGRLQVYYADPGGLEKRARDGFELRVGAHMCLAPPSLHPDTDRAYRWLIGHEPWTIPLAPLPESLIDYFGAEARNGKERRQADGPILPGGRHDHLLRVGGALCRVGVDLAALEAALVAENEARCSPPKDRTDVLALAADLHRRYLPTARSEVRTSAEHAPVLHPPAVAVDSGSFGRSTLKGERPERTARRPDPESFDRSERDPDSPLLRVEEIHAFAAVDEPGAEPLLGDDVACVLALDGTMTTYGTGGAAKTTMAVDRTLHFAAGDPWLGLAVPTARRVLVIENEGPRGRFRKKLEAKLAAWSGSPIEQGRIHVVSEPWGMLRFDNERTLTELTETVAALDIEVIVAGPIKRLGLQGGGTPEEVQAFLLLLEEVKRRLGRPLAYDLTHHTNKAGAVSGDWEGTGDTLIRLDKRGPGASTLTWEKARWGGQLQGAVWKLLWRDGERFEIDETPERTEDDIAADLLAFVQAHPGTTWTPCRDALGGTAAVNAEIRDRLLTAKTLVNTGPAREGAPMRLYLPEQAPPAQTTLDAEADA